MKIPVQTILDSKNIPYRLIELMQEAFTVEDVQKYAKETVDTNEVCKTIILKGRKSGTCYALLLRGNDKVHFGLAKKQFGEEVKIADKEDVFRVAEVEPGAVCPFILNAPLFVDSRVLELKRMNCGSGDHLHGLEFETADLIRGKDYKVVNIAKQKEIV